MKNIFLVILLLPLFAISQNKWAKEENSKIVVYDQLPSIYYTGNEIEVEVQTITSNQIPILIDSIPTGEFETVTDTILRIVLEAEKIESFDTLHEFAHRLYGFYPLVRPVITARQTYNYGAIFLAVDHYEYAVKLIYPDLTLTTSKEKRMKELKYRINKLFQERQWEYDREIRLAKAQEYDSTVIIKYVSLETIDQDKSIRSENDRIENEINVLTSIEDVLEYNILITISP